MNRVFRFTVITITVVFVIFSTMLGVLAAQKLSKLSFGDEVNIYGLEEEDKQLGMINLLLIGVDEGGYRSDTIMLLSVDGYSDRLSILSIPRDTMVKAKGYTVQKINALIGLGKEEASMGKIDEPEELLIDMVKELTGLPIHYFLSVDFDGFKKIVDAVDGVDFNVPYNMDYDDPTQDLHIHLKAGMQHLDGEAAHDFVRFRHNNNGTAPGEYVLGDEGREYWQQQFLKELVRQKCKAQYISRIDDLFKVVKDNVRTNYTMRDLVNHLDLVQRIDFDEISSCQLPGQAEYIEPAWWYKCDKEATKELINEAFLPMSDEEWETYKETKDDDATGFSAIDSINREKAASRAQTESIRELPN